MRRCFPSSRIYNLPPLARHPRTGKDHDRIVLKSGPMTFSPSEEPPMTVKDFVVQKLPTFNIAADGTRCRMNFISGDGDQACLSLPTDCLTELIVTLPRMMRRALRARHHRGSQGTNCAHNDLFRPFLGAPAAALSMGAPTRVDAGGGAEEFGATNNSLAGPTRRKGRARTGGTTRNLLHDSGSSGHDRDFACRRSGHHREHTRWRLGRGRFPASG